jgi:amino acid transporter
MVTQLRKSIIIAGLLFIVDAFILSQFLIAMLTIFIAFPVFLVKLFRRRKDRERSRLLLAKAAIYGCMVVLICVAFVANNMLAVRRTDGVIASCERFRAKTGTYPEKLAQLVPDYLAVIPPAKLVMNGDSFFYVARPDNHAVCYTTVVPYGSSCYWLEQKKWHSLD